MGWVDEEEELAPLLLLLPLPVEMEWRWVLRGFWLIMMKCGAEVVDGFVLLIMPLCFRESRVLCRGVVGG